MLIFRNNLSSLLRKCEDNSDQQTGKLRGWGNWWSDHDLMISKDIQKCFWMKAYNLGTKKAGHNCRTWALALERCLNWHFSSCPQQKAATKARLGCTEEQDQEDSFSLCNSTAGWWYSTTETVFQKEEWEIGDKIEGKHKYDLKVEEYFPQVKIEKC